MSQVRHSQHADKAGHQGGSAEPQTGLQADAVVETHSDQPGANQLGTPIERDQGR